MNRLLSDFYQIDRLRSRVQMIYQCKQININLHMQGIIDAKIDCLEFIMMHSLTVKAAFLHHLEYKTYMECLEVYARNPQF